MSTATISAGAGATGAARLLHNDHAIEIGVLAGLLALFNLHVFTGLDIAPQTFLPDAVGAGEWWRLLAHPFVHVTWYHLLLDGLAFAALWVTLSSQRLSVRLFQFAASAAGALGLALLLDERVAELGYCGLSGAAHGLMAIVGLEMAAAGKRAGDRVLARLGWLAFALVTAKSAVELFTGNVFFDGLQLGMTGTPIAVSHPGGWLGGVLAWSLTTARRGRSSTSSPGSAA